MLGRSPGSAGVLPATSSDAADALPDATGTMLQVKITIPPKTSVAHFVSPNTQSILIKEAKTKIGAFNTVRGSKGCKSAGSKGIECVFLMAATPGKHRIFTIDTYSNKKEKGSLLADASVIQNIAKNKINKLNLTLNGVVASIVVGLSEPQPIIGTATTMNVVVSALDASGATIVGAGNYVPTINLSDSDTSGATQLSGAVVTNPSTAITLSYNGANIASATINATATGVPASKITPGTMRPTTKAGVTVSGAAAFSVVTDASGDAAAYIPVSNGVAVVTVATHGTLNAVNAHADAVRARPRATVPLPTPPDECAPDLVHSHIYCMAFHSNVISILGFDPADVLATPTLLGTTTTDAPAASVNFSGATCQICGVAYDPNDNAIIISTANGYELWSTYPGATLPYKTIPAPISENFGYNADTDQIFSAYYSNAGDPFDASPVFSNLDLIDVGSGSRYQLNDPSLFPYGPDAAAVDTKTNIGVSPEEGSYPIYLDNFNPPTAVYTAPTPVPSPLPSPYTRGDVGSYTSPVAALNPGSKLQQNVCSEITYTAIDSVLDLGFFGSEYCNNDVVAVAQLPTSPGGTLAIPNYVAAELPNTPGGVFVSPLDPHAVLVVNIPGLCADCGVLFNYDKSYLAIVNLSALLALNPGGGELDVPTSNTLSGILTYIATGISSPPSAIVRRMAEAHRRHLQMRH
jgi:hypothetical protein